MAYNKQYRTRSSGRYNTPGQFVSAGESSGQTPPRRMAQQDLQQPSQSSGQMPPPQMAQHNLQQPAQSSGQTPPRRMARQNLQQPPQSLGQMPPPQMAQQNLQQPPQSLGQMPPPQMAQQNLQQPPQPKDEEMQDQDEDTPGQSQPKSEDQKKPYWMQSRLEGVKKISNKERRRRQNEHLRRLLTPKNALMALNEMMPNEQVSNQFRVEPTTNAPYSAYRTPGAQQFCADLTVDGNVYKGFGDNKLMARNSAAEQALRDVIIKKMSKVMNSDAGSSNGGMSDSGDDVETLPMIQLASFALHKLFSEWEHQGHTVPQLKPYSNSESEGAQAAAAPPKKQKDLPPNASSMHPCILLTLMRSNLEYRQVGVDGDKPPQLVYTVAVDVDGTTYLGRGPNKKEARKQAARAACSAAFNVQFDEPAPAPAPVPAPVPPPPAHAQ